MMKSEDYRIRLFATKLIWQLAFNCTIREELESNSTLMELLDRLSKDTNKEVCNSTHGALWVIQKQSKEKARPPSAAVTGPPGHIMISYQWNSQGTMLKVNRALQDAGIKVWMDVEQMAGSTLQAMAEAVEKASVVLIGVSAKYKDSPNCRTEPALVTWTKADVSAWLKDNALHFCLNSFAEYDGSLIYQLQKLRKEAPEFFYSSLRKDLAFTSLHEILQFLKALEKINSL
ncbi:uncharacterized protein LOC108941064 isoform X2 [Scleropages formosus]|uniref:uncharacterized protein LOC108941064 isoform X2 n=1 Tax=Scleropages formosus TaxID=113540 RepID=UPI00087853B7|nr:uncharacterized protein LOC108941064 isoform X2 [Scleropages formosus]